ncbi:hypothetical protein MML48_9g00015993 [Holotrichia oblita]|uniref:Uncharacterized protein n=1 Tax=Holotrichia oblita TaxID=644536 RepID=A0ACB9SSW8_HOLOL|nr:hypothetical protein MML48_9g00015993 [Holotrichia oblita]
MLVASAEQTSTVSTYLNKLFIDAFTGIPAKIHDARVFKLSDIYNDLLVNCGQNYHILGDGAYPIREWCLTPFRDYGNLSEGERIYNAKFCKTRVSIENTFGLLKSRFRQLLQIQMDDVDKMAKFILSCCVLHNLCIMTNDYLEEREIVAFQEMPQVVIDDTEGNLRRLGEIKRNAIKDRFVVEHV